MMLMKEKNQARINLYAFLRSYYKNDTYMRKRVIDAWGEQDFERLTTYLDSVIIELKTLKIKAR